MVGRIPDPSAVGLDAARDDSRHGQFLVRPGLDGHVFHIRRRDHASHFVRGQTEAPGKQTHVFRVSIGQYFARHTRRPFGIMIVHSGEIFVIPAIVYRRTEHLPVPLQKDDDTLVITVNRVSRRQLV